MLNTLFEFVGENCVFFSIAVVIFVSALSYIWRDTRESKRVRSIIDEDKFNRAVEEAVANEREKLRKESFRLTQLERQLSEAEDMTKRMRADLELQRASLEQHRDKIHRELEARGTALEQQYRTRLEELESQYQRRIGDAQRQLLVDSSRVTQLRKDLQADIERANEIERFVERYRASIMEIASSPLKSIPEVAQMTSDCMYIYDTLIADALELKKRPSISGAQKVREYSEMNRLLIRERLIYRNRNRLLETYFPWVADLYDMPISDVPDMISSRSLHSSSGDPVDSFLTPAERYGLPDEDKHQLALDRYIASNKKTQWQLGRDYELYIAHLFRSDGYSIYYYDSLLTIDNLQRHIRARSGNKVALIGCKYWLSGKTVHEKHIYQLFGVCMDYQIEHPSLEVACVLATNTRCTLRAHAFADRMSILIRENVEIGEFPRIKCTTAANGAKRFYLPMDPQYDSISIDEEKEFFATTVAEAMSLGYRRPYPVC